VGIAGIGSYVPETVLTNRDLERMVETSDEWITTRTGISERRVAGAGEATSDMAVIAARRALDDAKVPGESVDLVIVATVTPDHPFPAVSSIVQDVVGAADAAAFDLAAGCSGFIYALATGWQFVRAGTYRNVLVVGAETLSRIVDWKDRSTCVLFGDGAGAALLEAQAQPGGREDRGILTAHLRSDGRHKSKLYTDGGVSTTGTAGVVRMEGRAVFKHAVAMITDVIEDAFKATGFSAADVDWFVPHQANKRIIDDSAHKLGISPEKVVVTVDRHGNTSAASIPLALCVAVADGRIKQGDLVLLEAMGGGFTWGSVLLRW